MPRSVQTGLWIASALAITLAIAPPVRLKQVSSSTGASHALQFDATRASLAFWNSSLVPAAHRGHVAKALLADLEGDLANAEQRLGRQPAVNGHFFFIVRGEGIVTDSDATGLWLDIENANLIRVHLVSGPVVGTSLRDASGLLEAGQYKSRDFNALSTALNARSEAVSKKGQLSAATEGETVRFEGCAELRMEGNQLVLDIVPVIVTAQK